MIFKRIQKPVMDDLQTMKALAQKAFRSQAPLITAVGEHILNKGGKCLRPLLLLLSSKACGYTGDRHCVAAALIELLHTATLLHDDVVDDASIRRGQKTAKALWGNEAAILVGDFLYSKAFELLLQVGDLGIMSVLIQTTQTMAEGEALQLLGRRRLETQEADYITIVEAKTAKLFEACAHIGALLAKVSPTIEKAMCDYGRHLGIAFQLIDDVLDYETDPTQTGKDLGNDWREGKMTLPIIYALKQSRPAHRKTIEEAIIHYQPESLPAILSILQDSGGLRYTTQWARAELEKATKALEPLPESPYKAALLELTAFVLERKY